MGKMPNEFFSKQYWRAKSTSNLQLPITAKMLGYREANTNWFHPLSTIKIYNLYWGIEGSAAIQYQDTKIEISGNNFFFQAPNEPLSGIATSDLWRYYWLALEGNQIQSLIQGLGFISGCIYTSDATPMHLFEALSNIISEIEIQAETESSALAYRILLFAAMHKNRDVTIRPEKQIVTDSLEIIQGEFHKHDFDINRLAKILETHRSQIARAFRKVLNTTPSQILQDYRIKMALKLIQEKKGTMKEIALLSGFEDPAYFTKCIKKSTGRTPKEIQLNI